MYKFAQALRRMRQEEKGFTLVELMVVVVIIGILAAVAIPQFAGIIDNSRLKADIATGKTIKDAADRYYTDYGTYPGTAGATDLTSAITALTGTNTNNIKYLNSAPKVAQTSNGATLTTVVIYDQATGRVQVKDFSKTGTPVVWDSNS